MVHQYTLETYGEARSTCNKFRPYRGGPVDGPENGPPPLPWVIPCEPDHLFTNQIKKIEVPHTSVIRVRNWRRRGGGGRSSSSKQIDNPNVDKTVCLFFHSQ